jgi:23S rRNA (adenine2503-C2)-methyltransferase
MGIAQNLTAAQILDQVVQAGQLLTAEHRQLHNIVFMGMGEPFHNEQSLFETIECLTDPRQFARSPGSLLISTVGIPEAMVRFAQRFPGVNLALSLHGVDQEIRRSVIPLAGKYQLPELKRALSEVNRLQKRPVMLEYLMLADVNDSLEQAQALAAWVRDLKVHINLIPFNPIADAPHLRGSGQAVIREFSDSLKNAGLKVTIRYSLGADIAAACGQLVRQVTVAT